MRRRLLTSGVLVVAVLLAAAVPAAVGKKPGQILEFGSMVGVTKALGGAAGAIRGINGAGLPWVVDSAKGKLSGDGRLEVKVKNKTTSPVGMHNHVLLFGRRFNGPGSFGNGRQRRSLITHPDGVNLHDPSTIRRHAWVDRLN